MIYEEIENELKPLLDVVKSARVKDFPEYEANMNKCALSIALDIFKGLGVSFKKGEPFTLEDIRVKTNYQPQSEYLITRLLSILVEDKVIEPIDNIPGKFIPINPDLYIESPPELLVRLAKKYPEESASLQWLARAYNGMIPLVKGSAYPEDVLFPWGDMGLIQELYDESPIYKYYSILAAKTVDTIIKKIFKKKAALLEVGAGVGNGTDVLLGLDCKNFEKYLFTDIARSMVRNAKKKYADYPFMEYGIFDLSIDPSDQDIDKTSFDIVFAVNVVHAAKNCKTALKNIYDVLKNNGALVIAEISPPVNSIYRFMEITFGLIPSYNDYEDKDVGPDSPLLTQDKRIGLCKEIGFESSFALPYSLIDDKEYGNYRGGVIVAFK